MDAIGVKSTPPPRDPSLLRAGRRLAADVKMIRTQLFMILLLLPTEKKKTKLKKRCMKENCIFKRRVALRRQIMRGKKEEMKMME